MTEYIASVNELNETELKELLQAIVDVLRLSIFRIPVEKSTCGQTQIVVEENM